MAISGDTVGCHSWSGVGDATDIECVEARDAVTYATMRRTAPTAKNYCAQIVNSAVVGKPKS